MVRIGNNRKESESEPGPAPGPAPSPPPGPAPSPPPEPEPKEAPKAPSPGADEASSCADLEQATKARLEEVWGGSRKTLGEAWPLLEVWLKARDLKLLARFRCRDDIAAHGQTGGGRSGAVG